MTTKGRKEEEGKTKTQMTGRHNCKGGHSLDETGAEQM